MTEKTEFVDQLNFNVDRAGDSQRLIPAIIANQVGRVMRLGYQNELAVEQSLDSGLVVLWSNSRQELWTPGLVSGNTLQILDVTADCEGESLLYRTRPMGAVCVSGAETCFADSNSIELE